MADLSLSISGQNVGTTHAQIVNLRCPHCHRNGAFHGVQAEDVSWTQSLTAEQKHLNRVAVLCAGVRRCPNPECLGPVFVVLNGSQLYRIYPPEIIEFDGDGIPDTVKSCMEEAILSHASGCYRAAALMVRRTLEEMCNERGSKGSNLKERIDGLKGHIVIPEGLFTGAHELRFLGNDAAHIEATAYENVGKEETSVAIDLAKELLRATYQAASLVKRLQALKKNNTQ